MNLTVAVPVLDINGITINSNDAYDINRVPFQNGTPFSKCRVLCDTPLSERSPSCRTLCGQGPSASPPRMVDSSSNSQAALQQKMNKFYGINVNECTDVSMLQRLLRKSFQNFLCSTEWYECVLRQRNKAFLHRLNDLKKIMRNTNLCEPPETVLPTARRARSRSMALHPTTDVRAKVKGNKKREKGIQDFLIRTDRTMSRCNHQQASVSSVRRYRSLSHPVSLQKNCSANTSLSQNRLWNESRISTPASRRRKLLFCCSHLSTRPVGGLLSSTSPQVTKYKASERSANASPKDTTSKRHLRLISPSKTAASTTTDKGRKPRVRHCAHKEHEETGHIFSSRRQEESPYSSAR